MPAPMRAGLDRLKGFVGGFTTAQRVLAVLAVAVLAVGIVALSSWLSRPSYTPLFSGLSGGDAQAVVEQLRSSGVPYELRDGGATVLVPQEVVDEERIKAASAGLPASSTGGYGLLDSMGVTTSAFQQSVTYKRAVEGELAKTIGAMTGIEAASVQLALPEETVFVEEQRDPTASVFVQTKAGVRLTTGQVDAIVHLTSAAVEGMRSEDVAVIDADGTVLSAVGVGPAGGIDTQAGDYEQRVTASVQQMLDRIVGAGNATVAVAATISAETAEVTSERFEAADDIPPLSESVTTEEFTGTGGGQAGVLGPDNIAVPGGAGDGTYESESTVRNNAVDKVTEARTIPAGSVARQTVSVALDRTAAGTVRVAEVQELVAAAAGIDPERGDQVSVQLVDFSTASADAAAEALRTAREQAEADRLAGLVQAGILAAAVVIPLVVAFILAYRRLRPRREPLELEEAPIEFTQLLEPEPEPAGELEAGEPVAISGDRQRAEIARMAAEDPTKTAQFLRAMLDERPVS